MPAAHRRIESIQIQDTVGETVLQAGQFVFVCLRAPRSALVLGLQRRDLFLHRLGLTVGQRPQRLLDDVLDDVVGGVVTARRLALAPVGDQVHLPGGNAFQKPGFFRKTRFLRLRRRHDLLFLAPLAPPDDGHFLGGIGQPVLQQSLVDGAQVTDGEVAVVHETEALARPSLSTGQQVNRLGQVLVADGALLQEGVAGWVEQPAIVGRHAQCFLPAADDLEQGAQVIPQGGLLRQVDHAGIHLVGDVLLDRLQAVLPAVTGVIQRQQPPALGVEQEQQPVQQDQAPVVDRGQVGGWVGTQTGFCRKNPVCRIIEEALGQEPQCLVHPPLEFVTDVHGVGCALVQHLVQPAATIGIKAEGNGAEEEIEVAEGSQVILLDQLSQVHLIKNVQLGTGLAVIEPPPPPVREHSPGAARPLQVVVNLEAGVGIGEGVGRAIHKALVEGAVPTLGVAHSQGRFPEGGCTPHAGGCLLGGIVGEEGIVGRARRTGQRGLNVVDVPQDIENRTNPLLLQSGLIVVGQCVLQP